MAWVLVLILVAYIACACSPTGPIGVPVYPLGSEELAKQRPEEAARPTPGTAVLQMPPDLAFQGLIDVMVSKNIIIASVMKDAGLIRTGQVIIPNIDRSDLGLALKCGALRGRGASY